MAVGAVVGLVEVVAAIGEPQVEDLRPGGAIDAGLRRERPHGDLAVLARMGDELIRGRDQAHDPFERVAPVEELGLGAAEFAVGTVPGEEAVPGVGQRLREEPLPAPVAACLRLTVEQQEVAEPVGGVARGTDHPMAVAALHTSIEREHVDVGCPGQAADRRHGRAHGCKKSPEQRRSGAIWYRFSPMRCRSGSHCQEPALKGRRFCADHAAELDRMREELKDAAAARIGRGRPKRSSTCCRPGCYEPRVPPAAYCDTCAAAGYVEEAA